MQSHDNPRIYVACLAAYNSGTLHGRWIDAAQDADAIHEEIRAMLAESPEPGAEAEEYAVHDYDGFGNLPSTLGEWPALDTVARIAEGIEEHGEAFIAFIDVCEPDLETVDAETFGNHYRGEWSSEEDYAMEHVCELGWSNVFEELASYIDWGTIAREMFQHGNYASVRTGGGSVHVFECEV